MPSSWRKELRGSWLLGLSNVEGGLFHGVSEQTFGGWPSSLRIAFPSIQGHRPAPIESSVAGHSDTLGACQTNLAAEW